MDVGMCVLFASPGAIDTYAHPVVFVYSGPIAIKDVGVQFFALFVVGPLFFTLEYSKPDADCLV